MARIATPPSLPAERIGGEGQVEDHFLEVAAGAERVEDGVATEPVEAAGAGQGGPPQGRDRPAGAGSRSAAAMAPSSPATLQRL